MPGTRDPTHVVSRALVLSNALGAEGQCLGLARALGFHDLECIWVEAAALALAPRFSAAWSEKVPVDGARSGDNARGARAAAPSRSAPAPRRWSDAWADASTSMPRAQSAAAKLLRLLPASLHVRLHALWERAPSARASTRCGSARISRRLPRRFAMLETRTPSVTMPGTPKRLREEKEKHRVSQEKAPCANNKTLVLACGRGAVPAAAAVRRRHGDAAFVVSRSTRACVFRRSTSSSRPAHDAGREKNGHQRLVLTKGALHRFDPAFARAAREAWRDAMATAPAPRLVVAVGGDAPVPLRHA